jgi:hypothetical protein
MLQPKSYTLLEIVICLLLAACAPATQTPIITSSPRNTPTFTMSPTNTVTLTLPITPTSTFTPTPTPEPTSVPDFVDWQAISTIEQCRENNVIYFDPTNPDWDQLSADIQKLQAIRPTMADMGTGFHIGSGPGLQSTYDTLQLLINTDDEASNFLTNCATLKTDNPDNGGPLIITEIQTNQGPIALVLFTEEPFSSIELSEAMVGTDPNQRPITPDELYSWLLRRDNKGVWLNIMAYPEANQPLIEYTQSVIHPLILEHIKTQNPEYFILVQKMIQNTLTPSEYTDLVSLLKKYPLILGNNMIINYLGLQ